MPRGRRLTKADIINGAVEYIASKTIEENQKTILVPFITQPKYNDAIKEIFTRAGISRNVTYLRPLTEREKKVPINTIASSHMARRTFVSNLDWFNSADGVCRIKLSFIM